MRPDWEYCDTRKKLIEVTKGRKIYIFHLGNGGELWIKVTQKALLTALGTYKCYELNYALASDFKGWPTIFLDL